VQVRPHKKIVTKPTHLELFLIALDHFSAQADTSQVPEKHRELLTGL